MIQSRNVEYSSGELKSLSAASTFRTPRPFRVGLDQVVDVEHRFAEEFVAALLFEREQTALDRADRGGGDVAVARREIALVVADELDHRTQIFEIDQQQVVVVGFF